jgi:hypothetical protein
MSTRPALSKIVRSWFSGKRPAAVPIVYNRFPVHFVSQGVGVMRIATLVPHLSGLCLQDVRAHDGHLTLTFAERFPTLLAPYARRTRTLNDWLTHVAFALGGEAGARLLHHLGVNICGDNLLAHIRAFPFADPPVPRILSVDDFAFRRGRIYGSILVDLERHCTIDLLVRFTEKHIFLPQPIEKIIYS